MNEDQAWWFRLAVLTDLVAKSPVKPGRTAIMKFAYLLQTLRKVPLGYHFELYNYGPYDSAVLSDLSQAVSLKAIKSETVEYPRGYGYEFSARKTGNVLRRDSKVKLAQHAQDIQWVLDRFGRESASQLELLSTIVYANRESQRKKQPQTTEELCEQVKQIKPHFELEVIRSAVEELAGGGSACV